MRNIEWEFPLRLGQVMGMMSRDDVRTYLKKLGIIEETISDWEEATHKIAFGFYKEQPVEDSKAKKIL